ncbi:hypothetical protein CRE_24771 [Caenorhabditis remanei]|uniref:Uncharacterized protein n=1 Tax=Caenorhabditis remanei TaxID=31234 RepID=E3NCT6_CAERE|nr:hypothetical protein CRE_24771 [Caenorhabditis remanei]
MIHRFQHNSIISLQES